MQVERGKEAARTIGKSQAKQAEAEMMEDPRRPEWMDGMATYEEIGQALGVSMQRAKQITAHALEKIRRNNSKESLERWRQLVLERRKLREGTASV
jgi:DNA-directed RNA polymerase sigma subunit (sigma70/sigma32)